MIRAVILAMTVWSAASFAAEPVWRAADWGRPIDNWGTGMAFVCDNDACPGGARLFARTKVGFCNCYSGVADDEELDRIGDVDLHGETFNPVAPGVVTEVGPLKGRKRLFDIPNRWFGTTHVLSIVVATDCKAVVATIVSGTAVTPEEERAAVAVLNDKPFQEWAANQ